MHYFFDNLFIPEDTKLIHAFNKRFDIILIKCLKYVPFILKAFIHQTMY